MKGFFDNPDHQGAPEDVLEDNPIDGVEIVDLDRAPSIRGTLDWISEILFTCTSLVEHKNNDFVDQTDVELVDNVASSARPNTVRQAPQTSQIETQTRAAVQAQVSKYVSLVAFWSHLRNSSLDCC